MVLYRICPVVPAGLFPVVLAGILTAPVDVNEESADAVSVVTVAAAGVVAPTVPLILIDAVPVRLVTMPADGVPISGVVNVGLACITKVEPVPVCAATEVALPTEVIGPVRLALVELLPFSF